MAPKRNLAIIAVFLAFTAQCARSQTVEVKAKVTKSLSPANVTQNLIQHDSKLNGGATNEADSHVSSTRGPDFRGKPTKFDHDITDFVHTDKKAMHVAEAERLMKESADANEDSRVSHEEADDTVVEETLRGEHASETRDNGQEKSGCGHSFSEACLAQDLEYLVEKMSNYTVYNFTDSIKIVRNKNASVTDLSPREEDSLLDKVKRYARDHTLRVQMPRELSSARASRTFFQAFGLKKLLLPLFIGAQIVKSVVLALFLPTILTGIGKIVGKGLSSFAQTSQGPTAAQPEESFDFKDNMDFYNEDYMNQQPIGTLPASAMSYDVQGQKMGAPMVSGYAPANERISYGTNTLSDSYYSRNAMQGLGVTKKQDYKVFHEIPTSSLLLTNYDPFYSPLLSRLDAVFSRLGHSTEGCREYAVCAMYRSPARYAPYSNLVSAQLSRELNELRKPASDNPDVLRFFRYMKAAKDGQDGINCEEVYKQCAGRSNDQQNNAMLATYQDINKLVQARKL